MKKYLRIITFVLAIVMVIASFRSVKAADAKPVVELTPSKTEVKAGDTVEITVKAKYQEGISGIDAILEHSSNLTFEESNTTVAQGFSNMSGKNEDTNEYKLSVNHNSTGTQPTEVEIAVLKFTVSNSVKAGDQVRVSLKDIKVYDSSVNKIAPEEDDQILQIIVGGKSSGGTTPAEEPTEETPKQTTPTEKTPTEKTPTTTTTGAGTTEDTANKKMDYAGAEDYAIGFIAVILIGGISFIKYRQYKNI